MGPARALQPAHRDAPRRRVVASAPARLGAPRWLRYLFTRPGLTLYVALVLLFGATRVTFRSTASWTAVDAVSGSTGSAVMPGGPVPTAELVGRDMHVSWPETSILGLPATAYTLQRLGPGGAPIAPRADCTPAVPATSCSEASVPFGSWRYTAAPHFFAWTGSAGAPSAEVAVPPLLARLAGAQPTPFQVPKGSVVVAGKLYVADANYHAIRSVDLATGVTTILAGRPATLGSTDSTDGTGATARFYYPYGLATDGTYLFVSDEYNNKIRKVAIATGATTTFAGSGTAGYLEGTGTAAQFRRPRGLAIDSTYLYVADGTNNRVRKVDLVTAATSLVAGSGTAGCVNGTGTGARFTGSYGIAVDGTTLYVANQNCGIRKVVLPAGTVTNLETTDKTIVGLANSPGDSLYGADLGHTVKSISKTTGAVTVVAGSGVAGLADGTGTAAQFNAPQALTLDGTTLYVSDSTNNTTRKLQLADTSVTTLTGVSTWQGSVDAPGAAARFNSANGPAGVWGIASDGTYLYVTDNATSTTAGRIRRIEIATGTATTIGPTNLNTPRGIAVAGGNLYVVEQNTAVGAGKVLRMAVDGSGATDFVTGLGYPEGLTTDGAYLYVTHHDKVTDADDQIRRYEIANPANTTTLRTNLSMPAGLTLIGDTLYFTERQRVAKMSKLNGTGYAAVAGSLSGAGYVDATGTTARFSTPVGIATDGGFLYVGDRNNKVLRKILVSTAAVTSVTKAQNTVAIGYLNYVQQVGPTVILSGGTYPVVGLAYDPTLERLFFTGDTGISSAS